MRSTVLMLSLVCIATCQLLAQHGRVPDWDVHTVLHLPEEPSPTDYARIAILQLMHDKVVDPRLDVVRRLIRSSNFDWQTKHALQNEIQFQHSQKDRLRHYAPQPEDSILFAKVEANSQIFVRKLKVNPVIDLPYEFCQIAIPYCDGNLGALPGAATQEINTIRGGNFYRNARRW